MPTMSVLVTASCLMMTTMAVVVMMMIMVVVMSRHSSCAPPHLEVDHADASVGSDDDDVRILQHAHLREQAARVG